MEDINFTISRATDMFDGLIKIEDIIALKRITVMEKAG